MMGAALVTMADSAKLYLSRREAVAGRAGYRPRGQATGVRLIPNRQDAPVRLDGRRAEPGREGYQDRRSGITSPAA